MSLLLFTSEYLFILIGLITVVYGLLLPAKERLRFFVTLCLAGIISLALSLLAGQLYYDHRPSLLAPGVHSLFPHLSKNGFPSFHSVFSMGCACVAFLYSRRLGICLALLALAVAASRVLAGYHSTLDVTAGLLLGMTGPALAPFLLRRYGRNYLQ